MLHSTNGYVQQNIPQKHSCFLFYSHSFLSSLDEHDKTVLSWVAGRSHGVGLQVSGDSITVVTKGLYFIYSQVSSFILYITLSSTTWKNSSLVPVLQVLYKDHTWVMGHVITMRLNGVETKLLKCLKSMPSNVSAPRNTCYTAGEVSLTCS